MRLTEHFGERRMHGSRYATGADERSVDDTEQPERYLGT
jgi:hypothetical protein